MENFIVKHVGQKERKMSKNEFIMRHGYQLSIALMNQQFIESVAILDHNGDVLTLVTKEQKE